MSDPKVASGWRGWCGYTTSLTYPPQTTPFVFPFTTHYRVHFSSYTCRRLAPYVATPHENSLKSYRPLIVAVLRRIIRHDKHSTTLTPYFDALCRLRVPACCLAGLTRAAHCSLS
ncbi:hypothetical protein E2C01_004875 [Portunus trituberculatus]|uniref:Uncharacterized protein n=1 Tax=Portunus trituberculatus TaxID=210409 RepID=A0A5B7CV36_PORTR|nr:hypothetical protein [Portunus trituberculatus]